MRLSGVDSVKSILIFLEEGSFYWRGHVFHLEGTNLGGDLFQLEEEVNFSRRDGSISTGEGDAFGQE